MATQDGKIFQMQKKAQASVIVKEKQIDMMVSLNEREKNGKDK